MNFANPSRSPLRSISNHKDNYQSQQYQAQKITENTTMTNTIVMRQVTSTVPNNNNIINNNNNNNNNNNVNIGVMKRSMSFNTNGSQLNSGQISQQLNADVACFLMAMEIERLLGENDRLKYRMNEMEDKLLDRNSYEQQIVDLQNRLQDMCYSEKMNRSKYEQTTTVITTMETEINSWKEKCVQFEQRDRVYLRDTDEMRSQLNLQKQDNDELRSIILIKNDKLNQKKKTEQLQIFQSRQQNYSVLESRCKDLENKIGMLVSETERLNNLLRQKLEDLEQFKIKNQRLEIRVHDLQKFESEHKRLLQILDGKSSEYDQLKQQIGKYENEMNQFRQQEVYVNELQNKTILLTNEIERLNQVLKDKIMSMDEWKRKCQYNEQQNIELRARVQKIDGLQQQLQELTESLQINQQQYEIQINKNQQLQQQIQKISQESDKLKLQCQDYQGKLIQATQEIERLNSIVQSRLLEREEQSSKLNQLVNQCKQYESTIQNQTIELREKIQRFDSINVQMSQKERKLIEYENRIALLSQECERLNNVILIKVKEMEDNKSQYCNEINRNKQMSQQRAQEVEDLWLNKYRRLEATFQEYRGVEERVMQYQARVIILSVEIERLGLIHSHIYQENEEMRNNMEQQQIIIKQRDEQVMKGMERNNLLQKLIDEEKQKSSQYFERFQKYEQGIGIMQTEIERVNQVLRQKSQDYDDMKLQITQYQNKLRDLENRIVLITQENERLNNVVSQIRMEKDELLQRLQQKEQKLQYSNQQYEEYRLRITQYESQKEQYNSKIMELENTVTMLSSELERFNLMINQKNHEVEQYKVNIINLEQTIYNFQSYEENVRILSAEIDRLNGINEQQENELRSWRLQFAENNSQKKLQELHCIIALSFAEIESLRGRMQEKEREVEDVRRSSLAPYRR